MKTKSGKKCEICEICVGGKTTTVLFEPWCCWCNIFFEFKFWKCWNDKWKIKSIFEETKCVWLIGGKMWNFKFEQPVFLNSRNVTKRRNQKWSDEKWWMDGNQKTNFSEILSPNSELIWKLSLILLGTKLPKMRREGQVTFLGALFLAITSKS